MRCAAAFCHAVGMLVFVCGVWASNPEPPHLLLLLDSSASMASQNRIEKMNVAIRGWIQNFVPEGFKLSLWKFSSDAMEIKSTIIDSTPLSRQEILNSLPNVDEGSSCIACAIETVLKHVSKQFTMLLITDGNDKFLEHDLNDLIRKIESSQCKIIPVLMGNLVTNIHLLEELTQGSVSHIADTYTVLGLLDTLQGTLLIMKNLTMPINLFEDEFSSSEAHFNSTFSVDSSIAPYVCINLYYWPYTMPLSVDLTTPIGGNQQIPNTHLMNGFMKYCYLPEIIGQWKLHVFSSTFNKFMALQITANKNDTGVVSGITFSCWTEIGENYSTICASVHPGKYLINDTKISVEIIAQDGGVTKEELLEVHSGSLQNYPNENLYIRKHLNVREPGYYTVRCWAVGQLLRVSEKITETQTFTRVSWAGTISVDKVYNSSSIPPEIKDLVALVEYQARKCSVIMEFTVPSKAVKYKLMLSSSLYDILSGEGHFLSTVPGIAGTKEKITFRIPSHYLTPPTPLYIAISTEGENGLEGEISNIALVMCYENQTEESTPSTEATDQFSRIANVSTSLVTQDYNSSMFLISQGNISNTSVSPELILTVSPSIQHFNTNTSTANQRYDNNTPLVTDINNLTSSNGFTSNTLDKQGHNSSDKYNYQDSSNNNGTAPLGAAEIIGILVVVLIIIAVVSTLLYQNVYKRRRCRLYEVAPRHSKSLEPFNAHEDL